jgi:hypothetical protein
LIATARLRVSPSLRMDFPREVQMKYCPICHKKLRNKDSQDPRKYIDRIKICKTCNLEIMTNLQKLKRYDLYDPIWKTPISARQSSKGEIIFLTHNAILFRFATERSGTLPFSIEIVSESASLQDLIAYDSLRIFK